jgi:hypothetical protein
MRNTWRREKTISAPAKEYRLTDVLWWTDQDRVMKEIAVLMGLEYVDTTFPGWFHRRTAAAKNVIDNMSDAEKMELQRKGLELAEKGFPADLQRK